MNDLGEHMPEAVLYDLRRALERQRLQAQMDHERQELRDASMAVQDWLRTQGRTR